MNSNGGVVSFSKDAAQQVYPVFDENVSPIGYRLHVVGLSGLSNYQRFGTNWSSKKWLVGELYNRNGALADFTGADKKPFFTLPVYLGL